MRAEYHFIRCKQTGEVFRSPEKVLHFLGMEHVTQIDTESFRREVRRSGSYRGYDWEWLDHSTPIRCEEVKAIFADTYHACEWLRRKPEDAVKAVELDLFKAACFGDEYAGLTWTPISKHWREI